MVVVARKRPKVRRVFPRVIHEQPPHAGFCGVSGKLRVNALAVNDNGGAHRNSFAFMAAHDGRHHRIKGLILDRNMTVRAVLHAEFQINQAQKVLNLRHRGDGGLIAAATCALFNGNGGRDSHNTVGFGACRGLHHGTRVGVEAFKVAPLAFGKDDAESQR